MATRSKRSGKTATFGISVDAQTEKFLRAEAKARFGGNLSRLVTELAREEMSRQSAEWLLRQAKEYQPMSMAEAQAFVASLDERRKRRKKRAA